MAMAVSTAAAGGDAPAYGGREPPPPSWDGTDPGTELVVFEKNVKLWMFESETDSKKRGVRLLRNLSGIARSVADTLEFEEVACEKGVENILAALKSHFAPHLEVSLPRAFERAVYGPPRNNKETMQEYIIRMEKAFHLLEKESLKLPDVAAGYVVYRQAALTEAQELKFSTWSRGKYDLKTVVSCLRKLEKVVPEHKKGTTAFLHEDGGEDLAAYDVELEDLDDDEQYIYMEEQEADQVFDEDEVQIALATYQEVRKAINLQQKNRQYYRGGQRGSTGQAGAREFFRNKRKMKIEELKLRTRCGRCGAVGHWAKECNNPPDEKGRRFQPGGKSGASAKAMSTSSGASQKSGASQQSWYVAAGGGSTEFVNLLSFQCGGFHTKLGSSKEANKVVRNPELEDKSDSEPDLRGLAQGFVEMAVERPENVGQSFKVEEPVALFVGLTTSPTMAVVDTAAQDGLIGNVALERLKEGLASFGLQCIWTGRQAKAHGVGGQAKVLGIIAIPLGIGHTSGVLEATVVEGDVPLLLPIKMLRQLRTIIDLDRLELQFVELCKSVPLSVLPSGHVAVEIFQFGPRGFELRGGMHGPYVESDFLLNPGRDCDQSVMLSHLPTYVTAADGHGIGCFPARLQPSAQSRRCSYGRSTAKQGAQFEEGNQALESFDGQGVLGSTTRWARGIGALVASSGLDRREVLACLLRGSRRADRGRTKAEPIEVQAQPGDRKGDRLSTSTFKTSTRWKSTHRMGELHGLPCEMEGEPEGCQEVGGEEDAGSKDDTADARNFVSGTLQCSELCPSDGGEVCRDGSCSQRCDGSRDEDERAGRSKADARGVEVGSTSISTPQPRDEGCKDGAEESRGCCGDQGAHVDRVCGDGHGKPIHGAQRLPRFRDVELCSEQEELARGDASPRGSSAGAERLSGPEVGVSDIHQDGTGEEEVKVPVSEENWLRLKGDVAGQVERIKQSGVFVVTEVYVEEGEEMVRIQEGEVEDEEKCLVKIAPSLRLRMEEECEEIKETALPRKEKKRLRKAFVSLQKAEETYAVDVSEVFSPPRITKEAERQRLVTGGAYDLKTGFDLSKEQDRGRMWQELEEDEPELVVGSPPCTAFSLLQELNYRAMDFEKAKAKVMDGLEHLDTTVEVCEWQDDNGRLFLFEHPKTSRAFQEERMVKLMQRPGVWVCHVDMCAYGMNVDGEGLNQKPTCWVTNSKKIALQLQRRCSRDHTHVNLMGGRAVKAAEYPKELCKAIVLGLRQHLREKCGERRTRPQECLVTTVVQEEADIGVFVENPDDCDIADEFRDKEAKESSSESNSSSEDEEGEKDGKKTRLEKRLSNAPEVGITGDDKRKLRTLHVNLGHPSTANFLRFLRAGRVRQELLKWVRAEFLCQTCESNKLPKAPRPAVVPRGYAPGVAVGIDLFYIQDIHNQKSIPILNVVDLGTNYQMIEPLLNKEPVPGSHLEDVLEGMGKDIWHATVHCYR